jgi:hypothetical protein
MSQQTNLNVAPYFDDFNANNDYHKVLFKPGVPVQARELTTLQSILQNQIEKFGQHFFKEGAKVIPGNTNYNQLYYSVQLQNTFLGVPVAAYADQLIGAKITGQSSGITAVVDGVLFAQSSETGNLTLYVNYLSSSTQNNSTQQFFDGESLTSNITIVSGLLGNTSITAEQPFAVTIANGCSAVGSSFTISEGVYFIRGQFINVGTETLILDQYKNISNYRVGLFINEEIINSDIDETLNDNSQGFNNYAAPGADRLRITASLFKKSLDDFNDNNFIELATIVNGVLKIQTKTTEYNFLLDELARRTYNESGDYIVDPFSISIKESLNNNLGNGGVFNRNQFTDNGLTPSDNLASYQISPGKGFIRGYEVETISSTFLDVEKPRTVKTLENQSINYNTGPALSLNNVKGSPIIGIGNTYVLSLRSERVGSSNTIAPGKEIGVARVYDFRLESGSYSASNANLNEWDISLYDIQTITEITLNEPITLTVPTFVQGANSGASGFIKDAVSANSLITLYDTKGSFLRNESFIFDGIESGRVAIAVTSFGISDVKSVYGLVGSASTFSADSIQSIKFNVGIATISPQSSGISTVTSPNVSFPGNIIKQGNLISYSDVTLSDPVFARVVSVGSTVITITGVSTVTGIAEGKLPGALLEVTDFKILTTNLESSSDNTLYTKLPKNNISNVDLTNTNLTIRKSFTVNIASNQLSAAVVAGTNETFLPFDEERYSLIRSDGFTELLTSDRFAFINGGAQLQIFNLGTDNTGATLITTLRKIKPKAKAKRKNRVNSIIIDKSKYVGSGIGGTTLNDGLEFGNYAYGTRVQDKNISLNTPDIIKIHGIFESADTANPSAPTMVLSSINGPTNTTSDLIIGEKIIGQNGSTLGIVAGKLTASQITFLYKNQNIFKEGETVTFEESNIQAVIVTLNSLSFDISFNYTFNDGQKSNFYDYGFITRKLNVDEPNKKLIVYFSNGFYDSSDDGDITTANSYSTFDYGLEIKSINSTRTSDIIDIRPRVSSYTVSENVRSPLEFLGRTFNSSGNSAANILASDETILTNFSFYLGRIDRIYIGKDGKFQVKYGSPAEKPEKPVSVDDALELAVINLPPYLYSTSDASIQFLDSKRYRMVDIKKLEDRIKNLEYYTSLSLLETNTANLFVADSSGLNRFKSGFFVDNFTSTITQENDIEIKNSIDITNKELRPKHYSNSIDLVFGPVQNISPTDDLAFSSIEGINVKKSGDIVTLDYSEIQWLKQTFGTRAESVTPFLVNFWKGSIELTPASDNWIDTIRLESKVIDVEGNYAQTLSNASRILNVDPQTGFAPTIWNSWVDNWTGQDIINSTTNRTETNQSSNSNTLTTTTTVIQDNLREIRDTGLSTRNGIRTAVTEQFNRVSIGDRVVSKDVVSFMRSRNIQFVAKKIKPLTQVYAFFDGVDVTKYCVPKLLEISMKSGVFEVGETVVATNSATGLGPALIDTVSSGITFRVAQSNHKEGAYNFPSKVFSQNPYTNKTLSASYSSTSDILNVDTFSLANAPQGAFSGWVESRTVLVGKTSGAQATITNIRLISDISATLIGSFYLPNPNTNIHPRFESGTKNLVLISNDLNNLDFASTFAEEKFTSTGIIENVQDNVISIRNARIDTLPQQDTKTVSRTTGTQIVGSTVLSQSSTSVYLGGDVGSSGAEGGQIIAVDDFNQVSAAQLDDPRFVFVDRRTQLVLDKRDIKQSLQKEAGSKDFRQFDVGFIRSEVASQGYTLKAGAERKLDKVEISQVRAVGKVEVKEAKAAFGKGSTQVQVAKSEAKAAVRATKSAVKNCGYRDPLAQSFIVDDPSGVFITRCDIFFRTKDDTDMPVTIEIRTMQNGFPSHIVLPFSEVELDPSEVQISENGSIATSVVFKSPVYLEGGKEYCICLLSMSLKYSVFISRIGENDLITEEFVSTQPTLGSLFKSQNASTWEPSQWEDLKYVLYRADFIETGTVEIYNPELSVGNNQITTLIPNSINFNSKKVRISLASTISDPNFIIGNTILQSGTNASGNYVGNAGIATGTLNIINAGIGYTPSSGIATFSNVILATVTGKGINALAEVTISNGVAIGATITSGGSGYQIGDVLGISSIGVINVGTNARFSLSNISNLNQIIVDNVQGDFIVGLGNTIQYDRVGVGTTGLNNGVGVGVSEIITETDGLHVKVDHRNHGMYSENNLVNISNIQSDIKPTKLNIELAADSTGSISVDNTSIFSTFENVGVGTTNPGYLLIGNEIIEYTSTSAGVIGGNIVRGTNPTTHPIGSPVYKYELNRVSLRRINKTHDLNDVTVTEPITFDSYNIKLDMSSDGVDRTVGTNFPNLYANQTKSTGGYNIRATQNMPFEIITPLVQNLTVQGTSLSAEVRTITGSSISGNEISFTDIGFEPVAINVPNYLDSTRIIASKVNEDDKLFNLPGNKSMNMRLTFGTSDSRVSPVIDTQRISTILTSNRVNSVISNYATDARVNSIDEDPSAFQYISKEIVLENSASSIKIILDAHVNIYSNIRAFYAISENQNFDPIFTPFPGFNNLDQRGQIINFEDNNGSSDKFVYLSNSLGFLPQDLEYKEFTFTVDQLPMYRSYRIKLVMTSINQVYVPRVKNLRVITLA